MEVGGQRQAPAALPPGKDPLLTVYEAGWAPGAVWTGAKNLAPRRDSIPGPSSPVASRYTDWAIPARYVKEYVGFKSFVVLVG